jgi:hypothetical protein
MFIHILNSEIHKQTPVVNIAGCEFKFSCLPDLGINYHKGII